MINDIRTIQLCFVKITLDYLLHSTKLFLSAFVPLYKKVLDQDGVTFIMVTEYEL